MRIGLNLLHAMPEIGGGWNYIARLVSALGAKESDNTYVCFVTSKSSILVPDKPNFHRVNETFEFCKIRLSFFFIPEFSKNSGRV